MIISHDELFRTVMFLIDDPFCDRMKELFELINSKKFSGIFAMLDAKGLDSFTFRVMDNVPVILSPEDDDEDQEMILTTIYLDVCPGSNTAFFCLYTDEDATCRVEGGDHDVLILDEVFANIEDFDKELKNIMREQEDHEMFSYNTAYKKLKAYMDGPLNVNQEEFPF